MSEVDDIPPRGWTRARLGILAEYLNGAAFRPIDWVDSGIPIIRIQNLTDSSKHPHRTNRIVHSSLLVKQGDLLFSWSATLDAYIYRGEDAWLNQHIFKVVPDTRVVVLKFLFYLLRHSARQLIDSEHAHGSTMQHVNRGPFLSYSAPLPPLAEQARIADALDELYSDLDAAVASLERARERLKLYRAAVLKAAVEGALTTEWRAQHPGAEPASELLKRILAERRKRWEEEQLANFKVKGKTPPKGWQAKYREPIGPDIGKLPGLSPGWCWATLDQVSWSAGYGTSQKCRENNRGVGVLRIPNVVGGELALAKMKYAPAEFTARANALVAAGDLLVVRTNGSRTLIGRGAVVREKPGTGLTFASYLIRFRLIGERESLDWLSVLWQSAQVRAWIETRAATSAGQLNVSLSMLQKLSLPLAPLAEQSAMVESVEDQLSVVDHLEADLNAKIASAKALRQSILRHAFSGKLVPQDPNDEPASVLLERIQAERSSSKSSGAGSDKCGAVKQHARKRVAKAVAKHK